MNVTFECFPTKYCPNFFLYIESDTKPKHKNKNKVVKTTKEWGFENENTSKAWLKRQSRFYKSKKKVLTAQQRLEKYKKINDKFFPTGF